MLNIIDVCLTQFKIGNFFYLLFLPFLFIAGYYISSWKTSSYKVFLIVFSLIYYWFLLNQKIKAFAIFNLLVLMNITIIFLIKYSSYHLKLRKFFFILGILLNLIPLMLIKDYLSLVGIDITNLQFIYILGLSFFVFNAISLIVDFYQKRFFYLDILDIYLYFVYFPKIIAGPLVRFKEFRKEIYTNFKDKTVLDINFGIFLIAYGILKKWIADYINQYSVQVFSNPTVYTSGELLIAIYTFTAFIFLDFSGYVDIARGSSLLLGIRLPENFKSPYLSLSLKDFWRRWHITLYQWIKDYLYIGLLGGNKKGKLRTKLNILISFIFSGIWHGNYINYIIWGFFHGLGVSLGRKEEKLSLKKKFFRWFLTFNTVALLWTVFAITDIDKLYLFFRTFIQDMNFFSIFSFFTEKREFIFLLTVGYLICFSDYFIKNQISYIKDEKNFFALNVVFFFVAILLLNLKKTVSSFLYESF